MPPLDKTKKGTDEENFTPKETDRRVEALKLAYDALSTRVFKNNQETKLDELNEVFELAEYNFRFISNNDINIQYKPKSEKIRDAISQAHSRSR